MADLKELIHKTGLTGVGNPNKSSLLRKIQIDKITVRHLSRDSLAALIHKYRKRIIPRSTMNDAMLQNIKHAQEITKSLNETIPSEPKLPTTRSNKSLASSRASSTTLFRDIPSDSTINNLHGYRYRANGDFRSNSNQIEEQIEKYEQTNRRDLTFLKQTLLQTAMIHTRNEYGDYKFDPIFSDLLKRQPRPLRPIKDSTDSFDVFRFVTKDNRAYRQTDLQTGSSSNTGNESPSKGKLLIGRKYYVTENDRFVNNMLRKVHLLGRVLNSPRYHREYDNGSQTDIDEIPLRGRYSSVLSDPALGAMHSNYRLSNSFLTAQTLPARNSSINVRYGLPSQVLDSPQSLLKEYRQEELRRVSKTDKEIDKYIRDIQNMVTEREKKRNRREYGTDLDHLDFWHSAISSVVDSPKSVSLYNTLESETADAGQ